MYEYITKYDSPNFGYPDGHRGGNHPEEIIIHHWGAEGQSFNGVVNWLCNPKAQVSAHYVVEDGKVACIVNLSDSAWHSGSKYHNTHSIGIECRPEMTDGDLKTVIELVAELFKEYGVLPVRGHRDVAATSCPGKYYSKLSYIKNEAVKLMGGKAIEEDGYWGVDTTKATQKLFETVVDGIVSCQLLSCKKYCMNMVTSSWKFGEYNGYYSPMVMKLQKLVGAQEDGLCGYGTICSLQKFLKELGLYNGAIDGYAGIGTVTGWQKYLNMKL